MPDETRRELDELRAYVKQLRDETQLALEEVAKVSGTAVRHLPRLITKRR
ncbi:MAG: hypothetical protein WA840_12545 [Caulobacteraceae bacterium]